MNTPTYKYDDATSFVTASQAGATVTERPFLNAQTPDPYPAIHQRTLFQSLAAFAPRLHQRTSWTNLLTYSSTLANGAWTKPNLTVTDNVAAHPRDGLATLATLFEKVTAAPQDIGRAHTFTVATEHTLSIIAKANGRDWLRLHSHDGTEDYEAWFNLTTGAWKYFADIINATTLNGGFETAGGGGADTLANWVESVAGGSTVTRDTSVFRSGIASCRFTVDGSDSYAGIVSVGELDVGRSYRLTGYGRSSAGTGRISLFGDSGSALIGDSPVLPAVGWEFFSFDFVAGTTDFSLFRKLGAPSTSIFLEDIVVTPLDPAPIVTVGLLNGGFDTAGAGGVDTLAEWVESAAGTSSVTRDTSTVRTGAGSCCFNLDGSDSFAGVAMTGRLRIGRRYRINGYGNSSNGTGKISLFSDAGSTLVGTSGVLPSVGWFAFSFEFTATTADFSIYRAPGTPGISIYLDDVAVTPLDLPTVEMSLLPFPASGLYRCSLTFLARAAAGTIAFALSSDGTTLSYAGDTTKGISAASLELKAADEAGPVVETLGSARTALCPDLDPDDPFAYLLAESAPEPVGIGDLQRVTRTFSRIPGQQLTRDYQSFARPNYSGLKSGSVYAASLDGGESIHHWSSRKLVTATVNTTGTTTTNDLPSGTVTVNTTTGASCTFAANASKATIDAALATLKGSYPNGLASFSSFVSSTVVSFTWSRWSGGPNIASVVGPSGTDVVLLGNPPSQAKITGVGVTITPDTKLITCIGHGGGVGLACAVWNGDTLAALGSVAGVTDADHLTLVLSDLTSPDFNITHLSFADAATVRYAIGEREINIETVRDFFLPGVTMLAGGTTMATLASLPAVTTYRSPKRWLDRIVAGDTSTAINASQLGTQLGALQWRDTVYALKDATCMESLDLT